MLRDDLDRKYLADYKESEEKKVEARAQSYFEYLRQLKYQVLTLTFTRDSFSLTSVKTTTYNKMTPVKIIGDKTFYRPQEEAKRPKPARCIDINYKPEYFIPGIESYLLKLEKNVWNRETGVRDKIAKMVGTYQAELKQLNIPKIDIKMSVDPDELKKFYNRHNHFYNHHNRVVAKYIYWSLMQLYYQQFFNEHQRKYPNKPMNFNVHQDCHRTVMKFIKEKLGEDIARQIFKGGSIFGDNRTVEAMQEMGILDDDKYIRRIFENRFRFLSSKEPIAPTGLETCLRNGTDSETLLGNLEDAKNATLAGHAVIKITPI
ncbi:MAG TPA: hypothetical protein VHM20_01700 [Gammaproteobacteria bacterium]|jgi:hypothetical protein|nr:hypothetical protein [Gammaproteobacteria bacterium]